MAYCTFKIKKNTEVIMKKLFSKQYFISVLIMMLLSSNPTRANPIPVDYDFIDLYSGWNLISIDLFCSAEPNLVFSSLIYEGNLQMVTGFQNQQGVYYDPNGPGFMNTLTHLQSGEGYWVKVQDAGTLIIMSSPIPEDFEINLLAGWNLIGYWPQYPTTPEDAFADLIDAGILEMVTSYENGGLYFDPNGPGIMNTLTEVKNGFGYWVKVNADYPEFTF